MRILGLNHDMHISSAALLDGGKVRAAAAEERFNRRKRCRTFPDAAMAYCLADAGLAIEDIDAFAASWNPGAYFINFNPVFSDHRRHMAEHLFSVPDNLISRFPAAMRRCGHIEQDIRLEGGRCRVHYVSHHRAHAANAFFLSPFENAAIMTADSQGETEATTFSVGRGTGIERLKSLDYPQSLGAFYATMTEFLGFRPNADEWKVMALASFADVAKNKYYRLMTEEMARPTEAGGYEFDLTFFNGFNRDTPNLYAEKMAERFGSPRTPDSPLEERHHEIAAALQRVTEDITLHCLEWLHEETGLDALGVSGGLFMNSVLNGVIERKGPFERVFVSSAPDDSGNAIGAALYLNHAINGEERVEPARHGFFGPRYDNDEIAATLARFGLEARRSEDAALDAARLIADGRVIGWLQGRMEFGQRALGARSILADPRAPGMKDKVNRAVKFREPFRPFAPAVLGDAARDWFDLGPTRDIPFMEKVIPVRPEKRPLIPAVVHVDGSARLQTVDPETAPMLHRLIERFAEMTGVPLVLNTSFNLNGEPIVCSPEDAIRTFYSCGLDCLVIGDYVLDKRAGAGHSRDY